MLCGGKRRVIAVLKDERVVRWILEHLEVPADAPRLAPALDEPQGELWPTFHGPHWGLARKPRPAVDDFAQPPAPDEFDQRRGAIDIVE